MVYLAVQFIKEIFSPLLSQTFLFFKLEIKERKNNLLVCEAYKAKLFLNVEGQNYPPTYEVRSWCLTELKFELDYWHVIDIYTVQMIHFIIVTILKFILWRLKLFKSFPTRRLV